MVNWQKLQNGSDIRGVALDGIKGEEVNLTPAVVAVLGQAFVTWLQLKGHEQCSVAVGMDSRITGKSLKAAFAEGVSLQGANVVDCGIASTPAMFMTTQSENISVQAGVMLTASHLPFNRNGLKFFTAEGGLNKPDITEILEIAGKGNFENSDKKGVIEVVDFISEYSNVLVDTIRAQVGNELPLKGAKIIVDAGNGAGGFFADKVLVPLGCDVSGSQFLNPDGRFPNHIPNPEDKDAMDSICTAVVKNKADLGIIFDTDVDRSAVVDKSGKPINRNALIALISAVVLEEHPGSTIVTDSITSVGLKWFIEEKLQGKHHRFKRGYKNVINESVRLNSEAEESWLAIETSGHAALKENYFLDDGAFLVAKLLIKMAQLRNEGKALSELIADLPEPQESNEYRLKIKEDDFLVYGNSVLEKLDKAVELVGGWKKEAVNHEGLRVNCSNENEKGWFLLRMSLHDPVMPLNIESDITGGVDQIRVVLAKIIQQFSGLEASVLE